jgi:beta-phosphoglucomutase-like phosphatase (HAD superfamily)
VFLATAEQLGVEPAECVVIEDSANGIRAGVAAGMPVIAVPNRDFPPSLEALDLATVVIDRVSDLTNATIEKAGNA